jgi:hypothetical protein
MLLSVLSSKIIPYGTNNNRKGPWNFSWPGKVLCLYQPWHRLKITRFLVPFCETGMRHSAILSDLLQSCSFYKCDYTWPSIMGSLEILWLNPSDEYTFQPFIVSFKINGSLKFVDCFPVEFIPFSEKRLIHDPF